MSDTAALAKSLQELREFFEKRGWKHCLIGGLAANRWGETRFTRDIDLVVFSGIGEEEDFVDQLLAVFPPRAAKAKTRQFALANRVLLLNSNAGVPVDVSLGALEFEEQMLDRARPAAIVGSQKFRVASAEDIIVMKTVAGRPQDWQDIEGIIVRQGRKLDWLYIEHWLAPMLDLLGSPQRQSELNELKKRLKIRRGSPPHTKKQSPRRKKRDT